MADTDREALAKGQQFNAPTMACTFIVKRVAKDGTWCDITARYVFHTWTKRQPLVDGWFAFPVSRTA